MTYAYVKKKESKKKDMNYSKDLGENSDKKFKRLLLFLYDSIILTICSFKDSYLKLKTMVTKEDYIGKYLRICNPSEIRIMYKRCIAGGYAGYVNIKIFVKPYYQNYEDAAEQILNHEVLHQVLDRVIGLKAKSKLDNIQKSYYVLDAEKNEWEYIVKFVIKDKTGKIIRF